MRRAPGSRGQGQSEEEVREGGRAGSGCGAGSGRFWAAAPRRGDGRGFSLSLNQVTGPIARDAMSIGLLGVIDAVIERMKTL